MAWVVKDKILKEQANEDQIRQRIDRMEKARQELRRLHTGNSLKHPCNASDAEPAGPASAAVQQNFLSSFRSNDIPTLLCNLN
jgi:hypothetical protein